MTNVLKSGGLSHVSPTGAFKVPIIEQRPKLQETHPTRPNGRHKTTIHLPKPPSP